LVTLPDFALQSKSLIASSYGKAYAVGLALLKLVKIGWAFDCQLTLFPATHAPLGAPLGYPGAQFGHPQQLESVVPVVKQDPAFTSVHAQSWLFVVFPTVVSQSAPNTDPEAFSQKPDAPQLKV
jgi:hypothetical protein